MIILGCTGIIFVTGTFVQWLTEAQIQPGTRRQTHGKRNRETQESRHHLRLRPHRQDDRQPAGAGRHSLCHVDQAPDRVAEASEAGWLTMQGEATDEASCAQRASSAPGSWPRCCPTTRPMSSSRSAPRNMNPSVQIIARGEVPSTERKLLQAGANRVVLPAHIGADRIAHLILHPNARELLGGKTKIAPPSSTTSRSSAWTWRRSKSAPAPGCIAPSARWRRKRPAASSRWPCPERRRHRLNPAPTAMLLPGDALVVMKRGSRG